MKKVEKKVKGEELKTILIRSLNNEFQVLQLSLDNETFEVLNVESLFLTKKLPEAILEARKQRALRGLEQ